MAKRAQHVREDHLERQETADALRERIRVLFKLKNTPDDKTVKMLLSRLEKYKKTGYVYQLKLLRQRAFYFRSFILDFWNIGFDV